jgi:hypothetical protein
LYPVEAGHESFAYEAPLGTAVFHDEVAANGRCPTAKPLGGGGWV